MADQNKVLKWSAAGFFIIVALGFLFHYVFEWTHRSVVIGAIVPVNESVWEHLKLGLWGVIAFSIIEYRSLGRSVGNYFLAKATGIIALSGTILFIYYTYSSFTDKNILALDIGSYVIGVLICQIVSYRIFRTANSKVGNRFALFSILALCVLFAVFTYYPPHGNIFKDDRSGTYGIDNTSTVPDNQKRH